MGRYTFVIMAIVACLGVSGRTQARDWRYPVPFPASAPRALIIGDSNIYGPMGDVVQAGLVAQGYSVWRRGIPSTGLGRQDRFDWVRQARAMIAVFQPDVVIAELGGNDVVALTWSGRTQNAIRFAREALWRPAYEARAREFFAVLTGQGRTVFFLSPTNRGQGAARVSKVRDAQREAAQNIPGLTFIDMFPLTSDERGRWLYSVKDPRGRPVVVRRSDRIHLNDEGGALVGARVLAQLAPGLAARTRGPLTP